MRAGEKIIVGLMLVSVIGLVYYRASNTNEAGEDKGIPFFSTANQQVTDAATRVIHRESCRDCHSLWATRDFSANVPAPALDGMGRFRDEAWLYDYFSSADPQSMQPSRLKEVYRMPSYAHLPEQERRVLAQYIASLSVEDWYFEDARRARHEKLTGQKLEP